MIAISLVYLAGLVGLLVLIDRRLKSAQAAREAVFLRTGFDVSPSSRRPADRLSLGSPGSPLCRGEGRAAERFGGVS